MNDELTPQERALYSAVDDHWRRHYCPPAVPELWRAKIFSYIELGDLVNSLAKKGYLLQTDDKYLLIPVWVKSVIDTHADSNARARFTRLRDRILKKLNLRSK